MCKNNSNNCIVEKDDSTIADLKSTIEQCEKRYKESFKTNMCKEIMNSWYALQNAKSKYYKYVNKDNTAVKNDADVYPDNLQLESESDDLV